MTSSVPLILALLLPVAAVLAEPAAQAATTASAARAQYHVVEVQNSESTTVEALLAVLDKLGADKEKAMPIIEKIDKIGKAVVVLGTKENCDEAAELFHEIGMVTEVRQLKASDLPSPYDDSDVVSAGTAELNEVRAWPFSIDA